MKRSGSLTVIRLTRPRLADEKEESFFPRPATELEVKALTGKLA